MEFFTPAEVKPSVVIVDTCDRTEVGADKAGTAFDKSEMARMGKLQELRRNFQFFPIFGFAATLMITWEAVMSSASYILPNGGLAGLIWIYTISVFGFGAAILSMAEMASMAPTSGGQYHWVSEFAPKSAQKLLSYIIGWLCVLGWQAGVAGQCFTVGLQVQGLITLNDANYVSHPWHTVLLTIAAAVLTVAFNTFFARKLPLVEVIILVLHVCGFVVILVVLWVYAPKSSSSQVWTGFTSDTNWPSVGFACLVGITSPVYALIGPDSAVHMSEEVRDASRVLPLAMVWTLLLNGVTGFAMAVTFAYCLGPLQTANNPPYQFAFIGTFFNATRSHAGATIMSCIITLLTLCSGISNVATASRQMFAFARDHGLPFSSTFSYVRPGWDIPLNSVIFSFCFTALLSLINLGSTVTFNAILSIGVVSLLSSYLVSISCILVKRIRGQELLPRRWKLGKVSGYACNITGLMYLVVAYVFAFFPVGLPVTLSNMNWACTVYGGVWIIAVAYYFAYARHKYIPPASKVTKIP